MISRHQYHGGVWVDLEQPSEEEMREIVAEFSLSKRFEKEMLSPSPSAIVASDESGMLLVLHFPAHDAENGDTGNQEIDFVVGKHFIITVRYEVVAPLYNLKKLLEAQKLIGGKDSLTTDALLEILFAHLYSSVRDHTDHIVGTIRRIERDMFDGHERTTIRSIANINREFLHIEATLANQEEPLGRFFAELTEHTFSGTTFTERTKRILAERDQVARFITTHRAIAAELRETNIALLSARQNEIMKTLTLITVIIFPLELIAVIFAMHLPGTPFQDNPHGFRIVIGGMCSIALLMTLFFAKKRWLF